MQGQCKYCGAMYNTKTNTIEHDYYCKENDDDDDYYCEGSGFQQNEEEQKWTILIK